MTNHKPNDGPPWIASMNIATRQLSHSSPNLQPASDIEILGIATAICLLGFFVCYMLFTGLQMLFSASWTVRTLKKRGEADECLMSSMGRSQISYDVPRKSPYLTSPAREVRMKTSWEAAVITKQYNYTQIPARRKPLSRKPLIFSTLNPNIGATRWKDTTLDMEEGWSFGLTTTDSATSKPDNAIRLDEMAPCRNFKAGEKTGFYDRSFLHRYTMSL
ncbi:hypothetical protein F5B22DRAFT_168360 [Xylaria bambusicola]|uniref:uncharacterized protein n=1 Tax=Xylaria bambusicola TaxID=326684 RepID=UPI002007F6EE|nr:uncharacterized protein F5B22DRAFT_168360 [Xylaria bambusicola]KAI0526617.1 hypothetical protein F5B22DRAFT_168360 [Xylaria bambusicola]